MSHQGWKGHKHARRLDDAAEVKRRHVVGPDVGVVLRVPSLTTAGLVYLVADVDGQVTCTCIGFEKTGECKHALAYRAAKLALEERGVITAEEALRRAKK